MQTCLAFLCLALASTLAGLYRKANHDRRELVWERRRSAALAVCIDRLMERQASIQEG